MKNVSVVTTAFTNNDSDWFFIRESARIVGLPLHVHGLGQNYPHLAGLPGFMEFVDKIDSDYILVTDAFDVIVNRWDEAEVMRHVDKAKGNLFVSANDECWPAGPWFESYPDNGTPWRSACGGQYVGTKQAILELWSEFLSGKWEQTAGGSTQEMLHRMHEGGVPFTVDSRCAVFQIMGHNSQPHVCVTTCVTEIPRLPQAYNDITDTCPMFLHFGGRAPGLQEWFDKLYGGAK